MFGFGIIEKQAREIALLKEGTLDTANYYRGRIDALWEDIYRLEDRIGQAELRERQLVYLLRENGVAVPSRYALPMPARTAGASFIGPKRNY